VRIGEKLLSCRVEQQSEAAAMCRGQCPGGDVQRPILLGPAVILGTVVFILRAVYNY